MDGLREGRRQVRRDRRRGLSSRTTSSSQRVCFSTSTRSFPFSRLNPIPLSGSSTRPTTVGRSSCNQDPCSWSARRTLGAISRSRLRARGTRPSCPEGTRARFPVPPGSRRMRVAWPVLRFMDKDPDHVVRQSAARRSIRPAGAGATHPGQARRSRGYRRGVALDRTVGVENGKPVLADGRMLDVANVIWCTGFRTECAWTRLPICRGGRRIPEPDARHLVGARAALRRAAAPPPQPVVSSARGRDGKRVANTSSRAEQARAVAGRAAEKRPAGPLRRGRIGHRAFRERLVWNGRLAASGSGPVGVRAPMRDRRQGGGHRPSRARGRRRRPWAGGAPGGAASRSRCRRAGSSAYASLQHSSGRRTWARRTQLLRELADKGSGVRGAAAHARAGRHIGASASGIGTDNVGLVTGEERINERAPRSSARPSRWRHTRASSSSTRCSGPTTRSVARRDLAPARRRVPRDPPSRCSRRVPLVERAFPEHELKVFEPALPAPVGARSLRSLTPGTVVVAFSRRAVPRSPER